MISLKTTLIAVITSAVLGSAGLIFYKYQQKSSALKTITVELAQRDQDLLKAADANKAMLKHLERTQGDLNESKRLIKEMSETEVKVKVIEKDRIVYIERLVKENPELNNRKLSPVLHDTISNIQKSRMAKESQK